MKYKIVPVTKFQQNCTLLWCEKSKQAAIIDPGGDAADIIQAVASLGIKVTQILLTHGHHDHVGAASQIAKEFDVPIYGPHKDDKFWLDMLPEQSQMFGLAPCQPLEPTRWLDEGDEIFIGDEKLSVFHCPGHTPGHIVFLCADSRLAQVGDVLFRGSIGRTDFPQGNYQDLVNSIKQKLWLFGDDVSFIPGHGPMSTIGEERKNNPFVDDKAS